MNVLFYQMEFFLLILFSFLIPGAIYLIMMIKHTISRMTVLLFGVKSPRLATITITHSTSTTMHGVGIETPVSSISDQRARSPPP